MVCIFALNPPVKLELLNVRLAADGLPPRSPHPGLPRARVGGGAGAGPGGGAAPARRAGRRGGARWGVRIGFIGGFLEIDN